MKRGCFVGGGRTYEVFEEVVARGGGGRRRLWRVVGPVDAGTCVYRVCLFETRCGDSKIAKTAQHHRLHGPQLFSCGGTIDGNARVKSTQVLATVMYSIAGELYHHGYRPLVRFGVVRGVVQ